MEKLEQVIAHKLDDNQINRQLSLLYNKYRDSYKHHIRDKVDAANPYLITVTNQYVAASCKVLICGKDTDCCGGEFCNNRRNEHNRQSHEIA